MGEHADDLIERMYDAEWNEDADELYDNEYPAIPYPTTRDKGVKICRYCGRRRLHWELVLGKWRLCDADGLHRCPGRSLKD